MEENGAIKEAKEKLNKISEDEKMQQLAWWREKAIYEENTRIRNAIEEGERKSKIETAKKMKRKSFSVDIIVDITGLSKEEIDKL